MTHVTNRVYGGEMGTEITFTFTFLGAILGCPTRKLVLRGI